MTKSKSQLMQVKYKGKSAILIYLQWQLGTFFRHL